MAAPVDAQAPLLAVLAPRGRQSCPRAQRGLGGPRRHHHRSAGRLGTGVPRTGRPVVSGVVRRELWSRLLEPPHES